MNCLQERGDVRGQGGQPCHHQLLGSCTESSTLGSKVKGHPTIINPFNRSNRIMKSCCFRFLQLRFRGVPEPACGQSSVLQSVSVGGGSYRAGGAEGLLLQEQHSRDPPSMARPEAAQPRYRPEPSSNLQQSQTQGLDPEPYTDTETTACRVLTGLQRRAGHRSPG